MSTTTLGNGATLDNAVIPAGNIYLEQDGSYIFLDGTIDNLGTLFADGQSNFTNIYLQSSTVSLTGGGTVLLSDSSDNAIFNNSNIGETKTLVNVNNTIEGAGAISGDGNALALTNDLAGVIDATGTAALEIELGGATLVNDGLLEATGTGGMVVDTTTIDQRGGGMLLASGAGDDIYFEGNSDIIGGTLLGAGGGSFVAAIATLDGSEGMAITIGTSTTVQVEDGSDIFLVGTIDNLGTLFADGQSNFTNIYLQSSTVSLTGGGTVLLSDSSDNAIFNNSNIGETKTLVNVNNTIEGAGAISGDGNALALTNDLAGVIDATGTAALEIELGGATLVNDGLLEATGTGGMVVDSSITGTGSLLIGPSSKIILGSGVASATSITFGGSLAMLGMDEPDSVLSTLVSLAPSDTIDLIGTLAESATITGGDLIISLTAGGTLSYGLVDADPLDRAVTASDQAGGTDITITEAACYMAGTRIATAAGEVKVEDLAIGDFVATLHAGLQKIKWIGRRSYDGRFIAGNKDILPICIKRHSIAENVPARDLFVSPGHALCIDGALIHAIRLVNGVSIAQAESVESVTYYHIELETHEIIFAENCPAETFMGENFRRQFQNAWQFPHLYPGEAATETMCLPRLDSGFQLHAIQQRIAARAGIATSTVPDPGPLRGYVDQAGPKICAGWAQDMSAIEEPVCVDITVDGRTIGRVLANLYRADVRAAGYGSGYHGFEFLLPPGITGRIDAVRASDRAMLARTENAATQAA